jgi:hypothetical protein
MYKSLCTLLILAIAAPLVFANDGVFYASGDMLFPMKKTTIALRKEVLTITKKGDSMLVDVYFEFENPGIEQKLLVGFVTPPGGGDISDRPYAFIDTSGEFEEYEDGGSRAFVHNFTVDMNGLKLGATAALLGKSGFKLPNKSFAKEYDFVYHFHATFKPGLNTIHHTYWMPLSGSVMEEYSGHYRLTTGTSWANKQIDDFTLNFHSDDHEKFHITRTFWKSKKPADWKLIGKGKLSKGTPQFLMDYDASPEVLTMTEISQGYLQFQAKNFKPVFDLQFGKERKLQEE